MEVSLLSHPWTCSSCCAGVQALMGVVLGEREEGKAFCFACWIGFVQTTFGFSRRPHGMGQAEDVSPCLPVGDIVAVADLRRYA